MEMTKAEAIKRLLGIKRKQEMIYYEEEENRGLDIYAMETAKQALEKQIQGKVYHRFIRGKEQFGRVYACSCDRYWLSKSNVPMFCDRCGQRLGAE